MTVGFFGKLYLIRPALDSKLYWLVVITMINAAISAAYYLKIVATMYLRPDPDGEDVADARYAARLAAPLPITAAVVLSVFGTLLFGTIIPATQVLVNRVTPAAQLEPPSTKGAPTATPLRASPTTQTAARAARATAAR
jgi:NADH:ubiquinone oxidoreductase subunit 2 (subunit N)